MYCPHCGAAVDEAAVFCPECGGRLKDIGDTSLLPAEETAARGAEEKPFAGEIPAEISTSHASVELAPDLSQMADFPEDRSLVCPPDETRRRSNLAKWLLIGGAALLGLCACCFLSFILFGMFAPAQ